MDYQPVSQQLTFTEGLSFGNVMCVVVEILQDALVENKEMFEVVLLPVPGDEFKVVLLPGDDRAVVVISDGTLFNSKFCFMSVPFFFSIIFLYRYVIMLL